MAGFGCRDGRLDEAAAGEAGVIGDLGDAACGWTEGAGCLVRGELGLCEDQAVEWWVEDVDAQRGDAEASLGLRRCREWSRARRRGSL
jgi:hypothetical protein